MNQPRLAYTLTASIIALTALALGLGIHHLVNLPQSEPNVQQPTRSPPVFPNLDYRVTTHDIIPGKKRSLEVFLSRRVDAKTLRTLASYIKSNDPAVYDRTFIIYRIPYADPGDLAWATTHFNPHLEVNILGLTPEQYAQANQTPPPHPNREIIGHWLIERPAMSGRLTIYQQNNQLRSERIYQDGSSNINNLRETHTPTGRRFEDLSQTDFRGYMIIRPTGELDTGDRNGIFDTARPIPH